jgi:uncharacterized protein
MNSKVDKKYDWKELDRIVREKISTDKSGHDYAHIQRVLKNAYHIAKPIKNIDYNILIAACLLHDISFINPKLHQEESAEMAALILRKLNFPEDTIKKIQYAILYHNRGFALTKQPPKSELSTEAKILCDADRIDALGGIGIVRMVQFSTKRGIPLFISKKDKVNTSLYGSMKYMTNLGNDMLTASGRKLAKSRIGIMKEFQRYLSEECKQSPL